MSMQQWISDKVIWWVNLGFGEIIIPLQEKRFAKIVVISLLHLTLLGAILLPIWSRGYTGGILCWILLSFCLIWNICLDERGGTLLRFFRKSVDNAESIANSISLDKLSNRVKKILLQYIRVMIPSLFAILALVIWTILLITSANFII